MKFEIESFKEPSMEYKPLIRWWWPGLAVERDEIKKEIELMKWAGFGGFEIQPFLIGGSGGEPKEKAHRMAPHPYYYDILYYVLEEASKLNMRVDLNIGSSWPPGGTFIDKEKSLKTLLVGTTIIKIKKDKNDHRSKEFLRLKLPKIQLPPIYKSKTISKLIGDLIYDFSEYLTDFKLVAIVGVKLKKGIKKHPKFNYIFPKSIDLSDGDFKDLSFLMQYLGNKEENTNLVKNFKDFVINVPYDSNIKSILTEGIWQIFAFYGGPTGMHPISDAKSCSNKRSHVVNILNKDDVKELIDNILGIKNEKNISEKFDKIKNYFGKSLKCLFTDSQEIACEWFWTNDFFEYFKEKRGYDVIKFLPICFVPNRDNQFTEVFFQNRKSCFDIKKDKIGERIRHDWLKTLSELWAENYIKFISEYCKPYGLMHRIQTYGMPIDLIMTFGAANIPETETLFSGSLDFFKIAGSAGLLYNKKAISSETFSWMKKDLMTNPIKWKVACDRLFVAGINQIVYHGWSYQTSENEFPPRYPWRSHGFSEDLSSKSPYWKYYPNLNEYVARIQYILSQGTTICDVGIFYGEWNYSYKHIANEDNEEGTLDGFDAQKIKGAVPWFMRRVKSKLDKYNYNIQQKGHELMEAAFYYIHFNDDLLKQAIVKENSIIIGNFSNLAKFPSRTKEELKNFPKLKALIFVNCEQISLESAQVLLKAASAGVHIIFIEKIPNRQSGFFNYKENDAKINEIFSILQQDYANFFHKMPFRVHLGEYLLEKCKIKPRIIFFDGRMPNITYIYKQIENGNILFIRSGEKTSKTIDIGIFIDDHNIDHSLRDSNLYLLDPWSGNCSIYPYTILKTNSSYIIRFSLNFGPYGSRLLFLANERINLTKIKEWHEKSISNIHVFMAKQQLQQNWGNLIAKVSLKKWILEIPYRMVDGKIANQKYALKKLKDWRFSKNLKYKAPVGVYKTEFKMPFSDKEKPHLKIFLNLSKVQDIAEISLNNNFIGSILIPPYIIEITDYIKFNMLNVLEIKIIGTLQNLLIGYGKKYRGKWKKYKNRQLMPIGIIGPVYLEIYKNENV
ncbi:MAG: glycosyl hydrolase [Promethearchaeota archaeon]